MPPYGLYSLANTPEELLSRGYGLVGTEFDEDPAFGNLTYNTSYYPAPYTGDIPFQNVFRISEGVSNNFDNPSYGGSGNPRFNQFEPEGILSQVDSRFPLYDDFTVAEEGNDLEDNAVTVDELGNLKQPSGIEKLLSYAPFGKNSILGRVIRSLPQESPEIRSMKNFYGNRYGLTDTGQVASGIMKGYNPVSGGFLNFITGGRFGKPTSYGLADAAQRRIEKIANRKAAQTDASRAKIKELQDFARADTISRARQAAPDVYASADKQGFTDSSGGFKSAGTNENFSNKTGRGRTGY
ncbi:MAG: hypothetical protein ACO3NN_09710 [Candidatus Puniceispirillales bacterium]